MTEPKPKPEQTEPENIRDFGRRSFVTWTTGLKERIKKAEDIQMRNYRGLTKEGKWIYGYFIVQTTGVAAIYRNGYFIDVILETIGQQVGLKDKNGKGDEIYRDDIVSSFDGINYLVYYDTEYGQWWGRIINKTKGKYTRPLCEILDNSYMKIIGSIHTTPELMEQVK